MNLFADLRIRHRIHLLVAFRDAEEIHYPKIAPDRGPSSRRGKGRMVVPCNPCRNVEDGPRDK